MHNLRNYTFAWIRGGCMRLDTEGRSVQTGEFPGAHEDAEQHGAVEPAGVRVAKGWVVAAEEREAVGELVLGSVAEDKSGSALDDARADEVREIAVPGNLAEANDDLDSGQESDLIGEIGSAVADLFGCGLVAGRRTANDGADPHAAEPETVVYMCRGWLVGEAGVVQHGIEEVSGAVAGEDSAGAIAAVGSRGEAEGQDASFGVAVARHGTGPVSLIDVGAPFALADALAVFAKSRAAFTCGDSFMEHCEGGRSWRGGLPDSYRI